VGSRANLDVRSARVGGVASSQGGLSFRNGSKWDGRNAALGVGWTAVAATVRDRSCGRGRDRGARACGTRAYFRQPTANEKRDSVGGPTCLFLERASGNGIENLLNCPRLTDAAEKKAWEAEMDFRGTTSCGLQASAIVLSAIGEARKRLRTARRRVAPAVFFLATPRDRRQTLFSTVSFAAASGACMCFQS